MLFEYETTFKDLIKSILFSCLILLILIVGVLLSANIFYGTNPLKLLSDFADNQLIRTLLLFSPFYLLLLSSFHLQTTTFFDSEIIILSKLFKNSKPKKINYNDISWYVYHPILNFFIIKSKNKKATYQIFTNNKDKQKIIEILDGKIPNLLESGKQQDKLNKSEKLPKLIFYFVLYFLLCVFAVPIASFSVTKHADYKVKQYIQSGYKDERILDNAYGLYFAASYKMSYYNYKQILKIDVYRHNKSLKDNLDYVNMLFPNKVQETRAILKSKTLL